MRIISILCAVFILFFLSCASARQTNTTDFNDSSASIAATPGTKKNNTTENSKNTHSKNRFALLHERTEQDHSYEQLFAVYAEYVTIKTQKPPQNEDETISAAYIETEFSKQLSTLTMQKNTSPAEILKNGSFKSPFSVQVLAEDGKTPVSAFPLNVRYPVSANNGNYQFETQLIKTDDTGVASISLPNTAFTCNTSVTFFLPLETENSSTNLDKLASELSVEIPCKIYTDLRSVGGAIALVDFNKAGKSNSNAETSSLLLTELIRNNGFSRLGNADLNNAVVSGDESRIQREAKALFSNSMTYLIYGTVKYGEVSQSGSEYTVEIIADIFVRNLKQNELLFHATVSETGTGSREFSAATTAKQKLTQALAKQIKYGI